MLVHKIRKTVPPGAVIGSAHSTSEPPDVEDSGRPGTFLLLGLGFHFDGFSDVERKSGGYVHRLL